MAERSTSAETFAVTLTYNEETQENQDAARVFEYRHVKNLFKRLRKEIKQKTGQTGLVRYVVAGELGSKFGRCHWHAVIFSNVDLLSLGTFTRFGSGKPVTTRGAKITHGKYKKRLNWSMWPHGHCLFQEPDQYGIDYAISYALKDQFNVRSSRNTMRETRVDTFSAGLFRMSKVPPIGFQFLNDYLARIFAKGGVPTSMAIRVPEFSHPWYPTGFLRQHMLRRIYIANQLIIAKTGQRAPQWGALINSVEQDGKDWEGLIYGEEKIEEEELEEYWQLGVLLRTKEIRRAAEIRQARARCGGISACQRCLNSLTTENFDRAAAHRQAAIAKHGSEESAELYYRRKNRCNPFCFFPSESINKQAFSKIT